MKKDRDKIISWVLMFSWMAFIFYMSHKPGDISTEQSDVIVDFIKRLSLNIDGEIISFIVRKTAHVTEYMILFFLIYWVVSLNFKFNKTKLVTFLIMVVYASTDEIHQTFIIGREGSIRDVCIDSLGGLIGIAVLIFINRYLSNRKKKSLCN